MTILIAELTRNLAELSASFARIAAIGNEAFVPVDEADAFENYDPVEGITHV